mgnify:FL=1
MTSPDLRGELLRLFPVFARIAPASLDEVLQASAVRRLAAGRLMFASGNPCDGFPLLIDGSVRVTRTSPGGREVQLYRVRPGEACIMSTGCLLSEVEYGAARVAESDVPVPTVPPRLFGELMAREEPFRRWVFGLFSERLSGLMELVEAISFQRLDRRLAAALIAGGPVLQVTQQKLADDLGTVREMVGRVLRSFEDRGLVELSRSQIRVLDAAALRDIAEQQG